MKLFWCWRCQRDMPMLDEVEFAPISRLYSECTDSTKKLRQEKGLTFEQTPIDAMFEPVRLEYERLTGFVNCHQDAVMHHRASLYGPPCHVCRKPLRTSKARHCASCGAQRAQ